MLLRTKKHEGIHVEATIVEILDSWEGLSRDSVVLGRVGAVHRYPRVLHQFYQNKPYVMFCPYTKECCSARSRCSSFTRTYPGSVLYTHHVLRFLCPLLPLPASLAEYQMHGGLRPEAPGHAAEYRGENQGGRGESGKSELTKIHTRYVRGPRNVFSEGCCLPTRTFWFFSVLLDPNLAFAGRCSF